MWQQLAFPSSSIPQSLPKHLIYGERETTVGEVSIASLFTAQIPLWDDIWISADFRAMCTAGPLARDSVPTRWSTESIWRKPKLRLLWRRTDVIPHHGCLHNVIAAVSFLWDCIAWSVQNNLQRVWRSWVSMGKIITDITHTISNKGSNTCILGYPQGPWNQLLMRAE